MVVGLSTVALVATACGGDDAGGDSGGGTQEITFAQAGLGPEGETTAAAIKAFEQANPGIKVKVQVLSTDATQYAQQLQQRFVAGSSTPDVFMIDETSPATYGKSGWLYDLGTFDPDLDSFIQASLGAGTYDGKTYAVPWYVNAEGLFYRTDLVETPPTTVDELVAQAKAAMAKDPALKQGLAFEGAKYEGAVTSFMVFAGGLGGTLDPANLDTPELRAALQFEHDAVYEYKIAPQAVTGWKEGEVQQAFTSGQSVFSINWPFVFSTTKGTPVDGKIAFTPFLGKGGTLGTEMLGINAKTEHAEAAWKLIQYLTSVDTQVTRAVATGNPPSVTAAYNDDLYAKAPYFEQVKKVAEVAAQRPSSPQYLKISEELQTALSSVVSNLSDPSTALTDVAATVKTLADQ